MWNAPSAAVTYPAIEVTTIGSSGRVFTAPAGVLPDGTQRTTTPIWQSYPNKTGRGMARRELDILVSREGSQMSWAMTKPTNLSINDRQRDVLPRRCFTVRGLDVVRQQTSRQPAK